MRTITRREAMILAGLTAGYFLLGIPSVLRSIRMGNGGDFAAYYGAAMSLRLGEPIYHPMPPFAGCEGITPYGYPPLFAILMVPLTYLPCWSALMAWDAFGTVLLWASLWMMNELWAQTMRNFVLFCAALFVFNPLWAVFGLGQIHPLVLFSVVWVLWRTRQGDWIGAGIILALISWIQVVPGLLVVLLILRRQWKVVSATLAAGTALLGLMLLVAGARALAAWPAAVHTTERAMSQPWNMSALYNFGLWFALPIAGTYLLVVWRTCLPFEQAYLWTITTMLILSPVSYGHMFFWLLPAAFAAWDKIAFRWVACVLLVLVALGMTKSTPLETATLLSIWCWQLWAMRTAHLPLASDSASAQRVPGRASRVPVVDDLPPARRGQ